MRVRNMTSGKPFGLILSVALPLMLGNMFQQLYTVVDSAIVGNWVGMNALAAIGNSDWFHWMFMGMIQGFAQGFSIPIAQEFGANDLKALRKNVACSIILTAILAALLTLIAQLSIHPMLTYALKTPAEILPITRQYITILFSGIPFLLAYNMMAGILRSLGDGKTPLIAMVIASLTNIALDLLFVVAFGWGVTGAAIATLIGQASAVVFCFFRLKSVDVIKLTREDFRPDAAIMSRLIWLGLPLSLQHIIISVGGMILQRIANGMGVLFIAGFTATNKLYGLLECAAISFGYATTTYIGQNLGAKRMDRIKSGMRCSIIISIVTSVAIGAMMIIFGRWIVGLFISGAPEDVVESTRIAYEFLVVMASALPILYLLYAYRSALQGMGDTTSPMLSGIAEFIMRTASAIILPGLIGYWGLFVAEVLAWTGADLILIPNYYKRFRQFSKENGEPQD